MVPGLSSGKWLKSICPGGRERGRFRCPRHRNRRHVRIPALEASTFRPIRSTVREAVVSLAFCLFRTACIPRGVVLAVLAVASLPAIAAEEAPNVGRATDTAFFES